MDKFQEVPKFVLIPPLYKLSFKYINIINLVYCILHKTESPVTHGIFQRKSYVEKAPLHGLIQGRGVN